MKNLIYPLGNGGFVNRFITTGTYEKPQKFEKAVLSGRINEWLKKGFSIHENPCRKEFTAKRIGNPPEYLDVTRYKIGDRMEIFGQEREFSLYFPFGNIGVEASEFYFNPTYLRTYSYTFLYSPRKEEAEFCIETCGGVTLWVNDRQIIDFTPFTRNMVKGTKVTVMLEQGLNKVVVCLDDLAERDTDYYFRLQNLSESELHIYIPVSDEVVPEEVYRVEDMLDDSSFDREVYMGGPVEISIANTTKQKRDIRVIYGPAIDKISEGEKLLRDVRVSLGENESKIFLENAESIVPGFYMFRLEDEVQGIRISRKLGVQIFNKELLRHEECSIRERKEKALAYVRDNEVWNSYKVAAILKLGGDYALAERILLFDLKAINARKDCSDFYLIVIIYIYRTFKKQLSETAVGAVEECLIHFRYWIDEPGDDVMWFFSENHALLFHSCQYLAGEMFPETVFTNSGLTGKQLMEKAEGLLEHWFEGFFKEFITEWNSNAYIPVDVLGLSSLYNMTKDTDVFHGYAKRALDEISYDVAVNAHKGSIMTTFGRSYEKELKGNYTSGTTSLLYVLYNTGYLNRAGMSHIGISLGNYEPPAAYAEYAGYDDSRYLIYRKTQGFESHVNICMCKNKYVQLSTALRFKPFQPGYQEHIVQATIDETAQVFINHPGEIQPYGNGRPNFWAGNGSLPLAVQDGDMAVLQYRIPEDNRIDFTHVYFPLAEFDAYLISPDCIAAVKDGGYIGVMAQNGLRMQEHGPSKGREFISLGRNNVWVLHISDVEHEGTLKEFYDSLQSAAIGADESGRVTVKTKKTFTILEKTGVTFN